MRGLNCTTDDIMEFIPDKKTADDKAKSIFQDSKNDISQQKYNQKGTFR